MNDRDKSPVLRTDSGQAWTRPTELALVLALLLAAGPVQSDPGPRPIVFSARPGALLTGGVMDIPGGAYPALSFDLTAYLSRRVGYFLTVDLPRTDSPLGAFTARLFTAGPALIFSTGRVRIQYRVGYGAAFTAARSATLFAHGAAVDVATGRRWHLGADLRHLIPNDWVQVIRLRERYRTLAVHVGGGMAF